MRRRLPLLRRVRVRLGRVGLAALLLLGAGIGTSSAEPDREASEARLKAVLVAKVVRFTVWPDGARPSSDGSFVVGVVGHDETVATLAEVLDPSLLRVAEVRFRPVESAEELAGCHLVWISASERGRVEEIARAVHGRPVLLMADGPDMIDRGVHVSVLLWGDRVAFEVNLDALRDGGLELPAQMLPLARRLLASGDRDTGAAEARP